MLSQRFIFWEGSHISLEIQQDQKAFLSPDNVHRCIPAKGFKEFIDSCTKITSIFSMTNSLVCASEQAVDIHSFILLTNAPCNNTWGLSLTVITSYHSYKFQAGDSQHVCIWEIKGWVVITRVGVFWVEKGIHRHLLLSSTHTYTCTQRTMVLPGALAPCWWRRVAEEKGWELRVNLTSRHSNPVPSSFPEATALPTS